MASSVIKSPLKTITRTLTTNANGYAYFGGISDMPHPFFAYTASGTSAICEPFVQNGAIYIKCLTWTGAALANTEVSVTLNYM